jgi:solute carrier family 25 (adenine nucleotide translocator) protein 4/5/6/31
MQRVKVLLQVQEVSLVAVQDRYKGIVDCLVRIPREQGVLAFWRGNGVNVARMIPNSAIKFATYDRYKKLAFPEGGESAYSGGEQFARRMMCGALSGMSTILPVYPMDLARTRLTADVAVQRRYTGLVDCLAKTKQTEGVRGLYKGLAISLAGIIPYLAISLSMYDTMKSWARGNGYSQTPFLNFLMGSLAAVMGQTISYPLDTVRRHLQVSGALGQTDRYSGTTDCVRKIFKSAGWRGFYRGVLANGLRAAPQTGIEFAVRAGVLLCGCGHAADATQTYDFLAKMLA